MDMKTLRLFVGAAERLNISAAGRSLGMAPAVASTRLARLEHELGAELLHRTTRRMSLSSEGEAFLPYAREILALADAGRAALGLDARAPSGTLRFTAPSSFAQLHIMPLLPEFHARFPGVTLDLRLSDTRIDLIEGSFDLALRSAPLQSSSLKGRKLAEDTRILCAAPGYLERHGRPGSPAEMIHHDFIAWSDLAPRDLIDGNGVTFTLDPQRLRCRTILDDGASQREATCAGVGISVNSIWSVRRDIEAGRLMQVLPGWSLNDRSVLWLIYPQSNVLTPKVRCLMDYLAEKLANVNALEP